MRSLKKFALMFVCLAVSLAPGMFGAASSAAPARASGPQAVTGVDYYVAPWGSDFGPGTFAAPWQTVQKAADNALAGDTVYIRGGVYHERVIVRNTGENYNYITFQNYSNEIATIDGSTTVSPTVAIGQFEVEGKDFIQIFGLHIVNVKGAGIMVLNSSFVNIEYNSTYDTIHAGILISDSTWVQVNKNEIELANNNNGAGSSLELAGVVDFVVSYNHIRYGGAGPTNGPNTGGEGIQIRNGSAYGEVYDNEIHDVRWSGILLDGAWRYTHDLLVYDNVVFNNGGFGIALASKSGGLLESAVIFNNLVYQNQYTGMAFMECCGGQSTHHPIHGIDVVNNTFADNGWQLWGGGLVVANPDVRSVRIYNNLFSQNRSFQIQYQKNTPIQHISTNYNFIDGYRGIDGEVLGGYYIMADPQFMSRTLSNYHLKPSSPAIDKATLDIAKFDLDGVPRPIDGNHDGIAQVDMGVYEYSLPLVKNYLPLTLMQP